MSSPIAYLGYSTGSSGAAVVEGTDAMLSIATSLYVGGGDTAAGGSGLDGIGSEAGGCVLLVEAGRLGLLAAGSQPASTISTTSGRAVRMAAG